jgi:putative oxidoreductase
MEDSSMATTTSPHYRHPLRRRFFPRSSTEARPDSYLVPAGRVLFSLIFLQAIPMHFSEAGIRYAASHGVPLPHILVPLSGALALFGGLSVALGYYARVGAVLLALFLAPVTLMMHAFWLIPDPDAARTQYVNFLKNVALFGGALCLAYFGAGPISLDARARDSD